MELGIAKYFESERNLEDAIGWCKAGIRLRIEHDGLVEGEDFDWNDLIIKVREDRAVEVRLPLKRLL